MKKKNVITFACRRLERCFVQYARPSHERQTQKVYQYFFESFEAHGQVDSISCVTTAHQRIEPFLFEWRRGRHLEVSNKGIYYYISAGHFNALPLRPSTIALGSKVPGRTSINFLFFRLE